MNWPGLPAEPIPETIRENLHLVLNSLIQDLNIPPEPTAICRFTDCLATYNHLLPSENIFLSDPDYRGHYRLHCKEMCRLEYHKVCWGAIKHHYQEKIKVGKVPTEKDFLGQPCFTPDCSGTFIKIDVYDEDGHCHAIEDLKQKLLEEEERRRKEEIRFKREEEAKNKMKNENKKKKKKRKSPTHEDNDINVKENVPINLCPDPDYTRKQVDYSKIDLSNATVVKKTKVPENEEDEGHRRKKEKRKNVISLEEFRGSSGLEVGFSSGVTVERNLRIF